MNCQTEKKLNKGIDSGAEPAPGAVFNDPHLVFTQSKNPGDFVAVVMRRLATGIDDHTPFVVNVGHAGVRFEITVGIGRSCINVFLDDVGFLETLFNIAWTRF